MPAQRRHVGALKPAQESCAPHSPPQALQVGAIPPKSRRRRPHAHRRGERSGAPPHALGKSAKQNTKTDNRGSVTKAGEGTDENASVRDDRARPPGACRRLPGGTPLLRGAPKPATWGASTRSSQLSLSETLRKRNSSPAPTPPLAAGPWTQRFPIQAPRPGAGRRCQHRGPGLGRHPKREVEKPLARARDTRGQRYRDIPTSLCLLTIPPMLGSSLI